MTNLIIAKTKDFQDNAEKERDKLAAEIKAKMGRHFLKDEKQLLTDVKSSLMNHSRFVENVFDETNPGHVWPVEYQEKLDKVLSKANIMSGKVGKLESFLEQSGLCDHLKVDGLKSEMESLSQKVDGFVMQNLKIVKLLPRRIESLKRRMREMEDILLQSKKIKHDIC